MKVMNCSTYSGKNMKLSKKIAISLRTRMQRLGRADSVRSLMIRLPLRPMNLSFLFLLVFVFMRVC